MFGDYLSSLPAAVAQGIMWGLMAIGVYITYKILDVADLTVDGSICTGGAVCAVMIIAGKPMWLALVLATVAGMLAGLLTGVFHTFMGIPAILSGILTQLILWSVNLKIMGGANLSVPAARYDLLISRLDLNRSIHDQFIEFMQKHYSESVIEKVAYKNYMEFFKKYLD